MDAQDIVQVLIDKKLYGGGGMHYNYLAPILIIALSGLIGLV